MTKNHATDLPILQSNLKENLPLFLNNTFCSDIPTPSLSFHPIAGMEQGGSEEQTETQP